MEWASQLIPPNVDEVRNRFVRSTRPPGAGWSLLEYGVDGWRNVRVLDRDSPIALDDGNDDILAPQAGLQVLAGGVAERVNRGFLGNTPDP